MVEDFSTKHLIFERKGNGFVRDIMGSGHIAFLNLLTNLVQQCPIIKIKYLTLYVQTKCTFMEFLNQDVKQDMYMEKTGRMITQGHHTSYNNALK
jgi:hypothetical protein